MISQFDKIYSCEIYSVCRHQRMLPDIFLQCYKKRNIKSLYPLRFRVLQLFDFNFRINIL